MDSLSNYICLKHLNKPHNEFCNQLPAFPSSFSSNFIIASSNFFFSSSVLSASSSSSSTPSRRGRTFCQDEKVSSLVSLSRQTTRCDVKPGRAGLRNFLSCFILVSCGSWFLLKLGRSHPELVLVERSVENLHQVDLAVLSLDNLGFGVEENHHPSDIIDMFLLDKQSQSC